MLFAVLLLSMPLSAEAEWTMNDLEIYSNIRDDQLAVNDYGETFVVDHAECQIIKLNPDGSFALRFGKKGQGPGEFNFPGNLQTFGDHVYLEDFMSSSVICFDRNGTYVNQWKVSRSMDRNRISDGWLYGSWQFTPMQGAKSGALTKADKEFENPQVLFEFGSKNEEKEASPDGFRLEMKDGFAEMPHNPAPDIPRLRVLANGKYAALVKPGGQLAVDIYDTSTGKVMASVTKRSKPMAFNKEWGEKHLKAMNKRSEENPGQGIKVRMTPDFPEFFPFAKEFWAHADGLFYLLPWSQNPDQPAKIMCFDEKGMVQDHDLTLAIADRLLHLNETHGWVATFDEEEEQAGIAKVPRKHLADFIKANPVKENSGSGSVVVLGG